MNIFLNIFPNLFISETFQLILGSKSLELLNDSPTGADR